MYAQPGPGRSSGTPSNPKSDGQEKESRSRSFGEWITTTQGIITIIATLIGLIIGGGAAVVININVSGKVSPTPNPPTPNPSTPTPQTLTVDQVKAALLMPPDLASIDPNLTYKDVALPRSGSCTAATVKPVINVSREFNDGTTLILGDEIEIYSSANAAHTALTWDAQNIACSFTSPVSVSNISSQINGMGNEDNAWNVTYANDNNVNVSSYLGIVRCGRALAIFLVATSQGSSFDKPDTLVNGIEVAVPKVQSLL